MSAHGYSGKSLGEKLGLKPGLRLAALAAPSHYSELIAPLAAGVTMAGDVEEAHIVHLFVTGRDDLARRAAGLTDKLKPGAALWISWPKKSSPLFADLTEDGVRDAILPTGWVDVKVCAVDADWSGLKFLRRRT